MYDGGYNMTRDTADMRLWLFDLAHGNLDDAAMLGGFLRYYVLHDLGLLDVQRDIHFRTSYGIEGERRAQDDLRRVLTSFAG